MSWVGCLCAFSSSIFYSPRSHQGYLITGHNLLLLINWSTLFNSSFKWPFVTYIHIYGKNNLFLGFLLCLMLQPSSQRIANCCLHLGYQPPATSCPVAAASCPYPTWLIVSAVTNICPPMFSILLCNYKIENTTSRTLPQSPHAIINRLLLNLVYSPLLSFFL